MKIKLDEKEAAAIIVDWAKKKYKTNNVSLVYGFNVNDTGVVKDMSVEIDVMLSDDQIVDTPTEATMEAFKRIKGALPNDATETSLNGAEPDNSPAWGGSTLPL